LYKIKQSDRITLKKRTLKSSTKPKFCMLVTLVVVSNLCGQL